MDPSPDAGPNRSVVRTEAFRDREGNVERLQREADALRSELSVLGGYIAELRLRLAEAEEREDRALRTAEVARERLAQLSAAAYVRRAIGVDEVRERIAEAIRRVSELKDRERAQALRAQRKLRER